MGRGKYKNKPTGKRQFSTPEDIRNYHSSFLNFILFFSNHIFLCLQLILNLCFEFLNLGFCYWINMIICLVNKTIFLI